MAAYGARASKRYRAFKIYQPPVSNYRQPNVSIKSSEPDMPIEARKTRNCKVYVETNMDGAVEHQYRYTVL